MTRPRAASRPARTPATTAQPTMRLRLPLAAAAAALLLPAAPLRAQQPAAAAPAAGDSAAVLAVVRRLFDGMRAGDSAAVRAVFHPSARLVTSVERAGRPTVTVDSVGTFVRAVGTPHKDVWDERLTGTVVHVSDGLAAVWTDYSFYAGPRFSHCGVDAFHLGRTPAGWQIVALADTRRRTGCPGQPAAR